MKTSIKWIIGLGAAFVVCIAIACTLFFTAINVGDIKDDVLNNGGVIFNRNRVKEINFYEEKSIDGIEKIEIDVSSGDVEIIETEGNNLTVSINGRYYNIPSSSEGYNLKLTSVEEILKLEIKEDWKFFSFGSFFIGDIIIEIPGSFEGELDLEVGSGSAEINIDSVNKKFNNFKLALYSGFTSIQKLNAKEADIKVFSGNLEIYYCKIDGNLKTTVYSGFAEIKGEFKTLNATVYSGMIDIETAKEIAGDYKIKVDSGTFFLKLPGISYRLIVDISSGSFKDKIGKWHHKDFETGNGFYKIEFDISSGHAEIK